MLQLFGCFTVKNLKNKTNRPDERALKIMFLYLVCLFDLLGCFFLFVFICVLFFCFFPPFLFKSHFTVHLN